MTASNTVSLYTHFRTVCNFTTIDKHNKENYTIDAIKGSYIVLLCQLVVYLEKTRKTCNFLIGKYNWLQIVKFRQSHITM